MRLDTHLRVLPEALGAATVKLDLQTLGSLMAKPLLYYDFACYF